jgi:transposase
MQPSSQRRVHRAEFKAQVLAECQRPGASVAAVALAHGLNVNLVRKWLIGRGLKRAGLTAPRAVVAQAQPAAPVVRTISATPLPFVPVKLQAQSQGPDAAARPDERVLAAAADIHIELRRGGAQLSVRWPATQAQSCAVWLAELAGTALKG